MDFTDSSVKTQDVICVNSIYKNANPSPQPTVLGGPLKVALHAKVKMYFVIQNVYRVMRGQQTHTNLTTFVYV